MDKPNILHLFVDQQRFDTIHALNNPTIKTPNLDRIIKEGVAFTNAYTPCPVCIAARCSMIYGQYPMNTGCYENTKMPTDERKSFMHELGNNGYITHGIGKCHFSPNSFDLRGFQKRERQEEYIADKNKYEPYYEMLKNNGYDYVCEPNGIRSEMYYIPQPSQLPEKLHPSTWIADRSIEFIKKEKNKPFYLFSSFIHPHPPFSPPNPWHKMYRAAMMPLPNVPKDVNNLQTFVNKVQNRYKYRDFGIDNNLLRVMKAYYYACITFVDYQIGRIIECLEKENLIDNTLILFTSDHGEHLGDYNCFGKRSFHDSASRIPMIVSMKNRFEGGITCDTPVSLVDLAPTFLKVAKVDNPNMQIDGEDLYDILKGRSNRKVVFGQHSYEYGNPVEGRGIPSKYADDKDIWRAMQSSYMAVSKEWKYFYSARDNEEFFFDKINDPFETRNRAGVSFVNDQLVNMRESTINFLQKGNECAGIENNKFKEFSFKPISKDPDTGLLVQDSYMPWAKKSIDGY